MKKKKHECSRVTSTTFESTTKIDRVPSLDRLKDFYDLLLSVSIFVSLDDHRLILKGERCRIDIILRNVLYQYLAYNNLYVAIKKILYKLKNINTEITLFFHLCVEFLLMIICIFFYGIY